MRPRTALFKQPYIDPVTLFKTGDVGGVWDASSISTLFKEMAGTTPVTAAGDTVGNWKCLVNTNHLLAQADTTVRPLYDDVEKAISWTFGTTFVLSAAITLTSSTYTLMMVAKPTNTVESNGRLASMCGSVFVSTDYDATTRMVLFQRDGTNNAYKSYRNSAALSIAPHNPGDRKLFKMVLNGSNNRVAVGRASGVDFASTTAMNTTVFHIGGFAQNASAGRYDGKIYHVFLIDRVLQPYEERGVENFLSKKWGL